MRALVDYPDGLSLEAIAQRVNLPRSTVQRIVGALAEERFLIAATPNARVRLGPGLVPLGTAAKADFDAVVRPYLQELCLQAQEAVDLAMLDGNRILFIDQILPSPYGLMVVSRIGKTFPPHSCAIGKAALAQLDDDELAAALTLPLSRETDKTITSVTKLKEQLAQIREEGISYAEEEYSEGVSSVGASITEPYGRRLAIAIPTPTVRFAAKKQKLAELLEDTGKRIRVALGNQTENSP